MEDTLTRMFQDIFARLDGPLHFRFYFQPAMAIFLAVRDGLKDDREGKPPFFWSLFTATGQRRELMRDGWKSISKVFIIAIVLDVIYQAIALHWFYPVETLLVAVILALMPYIMIRGLVNRFKRGSQKPASPHA